MLDTEFNDWPLLERLNETLAIFMQRLEDEKRALTDQKIDDILAITDQKHDIITRLEQQLAQLSPYDINHIQQAAQQSAANQALARAFIAASQQAEQANQRNQQLLARLYKLNSQLLGGLNPARPNPFQGYSQTGLPKKNSSNRSLGEA